MTLIHLASTQPAKIAAAKEIFDTVIPHPAKSGVPEQPVGREEIRGGAYNRFETVVYYQLPMLSMESGIIDHPTEPRDETCVVLRTHLGDFEQWVSHRIRAKDKYRAWKGLPNMHDVTFGSMAFPDHCHDWYEADDGQYSREELMGLAVRRAWSDYERFRDSLPTLTIPASLKQFRGVEFLDLQTPLLNHSSELLETTFRLTNNLLFDKIVVLDARGFLLAGEFMRKKYPIVLVRKPGKLPSEELTVSYQKEYGTDQLCISKGAIGPGDRVIVVDDVIATGGTMRAAEDLVIAAGGRVVAFVAPYAIVNDQNELICGDIVGRCRFLCTQKQANNPPDEKVEPVRNCSNMNRSVQIFPPSLRTYSGRNVIPVRWGRFARSSNIWMNCTNIAGNHVYVFMDPSNAAESFDVLQLLQIMHRKDPASITVVIPFLEQATQDRVEYDQDWESLAAVDTVAKLLSQHKVLTFDLHAEQSRFAFHDLRYDNLVSVLWQDYIRYFPDAVPVFPDEGAAKRYGKVPGRNSIVFRKVRRGAARIVSTDQEIVGDRFVIIDDLVRSGGTMNEVAKYLYSHGAKIVDALFTHAPLEPAAAKNMEVFRNIWTTDTCPTVVPREWVRLRISDYLNDKFGSAEEFLPLSSHPFPTFVPGYNHIGP